MTVHWVVGFSWLHFFKKNLHLFLSSAWSTAIHNVCNEGKYNLQQRCSVPPGLWILTSKWKTFCSFCLKSIKSIDECTRPGPVGFLHGFLHFVSLSFLFHTIWPGFSPSLVKMDHQAWRFKKLDWVFFRSPAHESPAVDGFWDFSFQETWKVHLQIPVSC